MSLRDTVQRAIQQGMNALGDIQETVAYTKVTGINYDPATGVADKTMQSYPGVKAVMDQYHRRELDDDAIRPEDVKCLIAKRTLTPVPGLNDVVTRPDGTVWVVMSVQTDPANAHWQLQLRKP